MHSRVQVCLLLKCRLSELCACICQDLDSAVCPNVLFVWQVLGKFDPINSCIRHLERMLRRHCVGTIVKPINQSTHAADAI